MRNMRKKNIMLVVILLIVLIGGIYLIKILKGPAIKSFYVNQSNLVVEAQNMGKIDVFVESDATNGVELVGSMELVEQNEENDQTWFLAVPQYIGTSTKIFAQGFTKEGKTTKKVSLPPGELEEVVISSLDQIDNSYAVLFGTVNSVTGNMLSLNIHASTTIKVTLVSDVVVTNKAGQKILPSQLIRGGLVSVTGQFKDEISFVASEVAEELPQTQN